MDRNNHQGGYAEALVRVLSAAAGLRLAKPEPDLDGIDFCLWPDRVGGRRGARSTPINVQVKSDSIAAGDATHWRHYLKVPHFNALADPDTTFPTYLFLVIVPSEPRHYVSLHPDGLLLRKSVYWHSLAKDGPVVDAKKDAKKRVDIPKANLLTVDSLRTLVNAADPGGEPS
ncbi:DUF4365 domain-containing protein [Actinoallomurus sp. NPDC052274]|uniref:DUF4365 domain-containing protein n=1 Tax=Actinoallomurus sp. NPDC052274 TaxID=3155420 RepID=UPI003435EE19